MEQVESTSSPYMRDGKGLSTAKGGRLAQWLVLQTELRGKKKTGMQAAAGLCYSYRSALNLPVHCHVPRTPWRTF
jgi:hypothetical protein